MATIYRETLIERCPDETWDALRDVGALHTRLVPGFVTGTTLEPGARLVTFANGRTVRERIVGVDDANRRVAWSVADAPFEHHNASAQVVPLGPALCRFVWVADVLPDAVAPLVTGLIEQGLGVIKKTLESEA